MAITLTQNLVYKLTIDKKPAKEIDGKVIYEDNPDRKTYFITDNHRDAPTGFGIMISQAKSADKPHKVYYIQRKIGGKLFKRSVGQVRDFTTIEAARNKSRGLTADIIERSQNPNHSQARKKAENLTVANAFESYTHHLKTRATPAKENSLKGVRNGYKKLEEWHETRIKDLTADLILNKFDTIAFKTRTSAEQVFRVAHTAIQHVIDLEMNDAQTQGRLPALSYNPLKILQLKQKYRTKTQLEAAYTSSGVRNPLNPDVKMKQWLEAIWDKRSGNRTGADYLLLLTLWGNRKNEVYKLKWRCLLTDDEARTTSWVDLAERKAFFYDTKNHANQTIPIADCALELLKQRRDLRNDVIAKNKIWVFPAMSKFSKTGHYSDSKEILASAKKAAQIFNRFGHHDLRRTFGGLAEDLGLPHAATKRLLNHSTISNPTSRYTEVSWDRLVEYMTRIERKFLSYTPKVYEALNAIEINK